MEEAAARFPQRKAYEDETCSMTFSEVRRLAASIGTGIAALETPGRPVAVFMEKSAWMAVSLLGVSCGGCIYCPVDVAMPEARMDRILSVLEPAAVLTSGSMEARAREVCGDCPVLLVEDLAARPADEALLASLRACIVPSDPLYILFTSGSTGMPKGVVGTHQTVLNNLEWLAFRFDLGPDDVLGNQAPLHFVVADHDLYCPLKFGCRSFFIPAGYFSFPAKLIPLLNQHRVTTVFWVPFALGTIASLRALDEILPEFLRYVFFVGEVMPVRQLNYWRAHVPSAHYINLYGSTEMYMCCYYEVDQEYTETDTLPIGGPCGGIGTLVLDEMDREILPGTAEIGELCIRGTAVGPGYYRDPEQTARKFIQNPLEPAAREVIYRTGDLVRYGNDGLLEFCGRADHQIKHLGYRIELGEIEAAAGKVPEISSCACVYDQKKQRILFFYDGTETDRKTISSSLSQQLPRYMLPSRYVYLDPLPRNASGKIDRKYLQEQYS